MKTIKDCLPERDEYFAFRVFKREEAQVRFRNGGWGHVYEPVTSLPKNKDIRARIIELSCN